MALARRNGRRFEANIWPGFVDALTALLLILMFVLSIFMIVQFSLRETITGQSQRLNDLTAQLSSISDVLALERTRSSELEGEVGSLRATLVNQQAEAGRLTAALAALTRERDDAIGRISELEGSLAASIDEQEAAALALSSARSEIDAQAEAARLAAARREAMEAMIARLESENTDRDREISTLETDKASALAMIAALQAETADSADALTLAESEQARLAAERDALSGLIADLRTDNSDLEASAGELERQRDENAALRAQALAQLEEAEINLSAAEEARLLEAAAAEALRQRLEQDSAELDAVTLALEQARAEAEQTLTLLAAAEATRLELEDKAQDVDREAALRKVAEAALADANEQTVEQARQVALLNAQVSQLNTQLSSLSQVLDETAEKEVEGQVQISNLGQQLNAALARKVALEAENAGLLAAQVDELEKVRSIFLERVEAALSGRDGIRRVGDRFVFQSEVLFDPGSAVLGPAGQAELAKLGEILREVSADLPADVNWILRVDGHTDRIPLTGSGRYRNNWELSQGRALSVVTYLVQREGVDPARLAATGFGEFQPLTDGDTTEDRARNRRIEVKFTER